MAKRLRIYVDTSVIGGCLDPEFETWSRALFRELVTLGAETLPVTTGALRLVSAYTRRRILGPRFRNDMLHIAVATVAEADALVSWNFRHVVRFDKIRLFNGINLDHGYRELSIYSPREVTTHGRGQRG
jgi:hypothetical protein